MILQICSMFATFLLLVSWCFDSTAAARDKSFLQSSCRRQLWLTGMQLSHGEFGGLGSEGYLDHMLVAIASAKINAPSLVPVVILMASDGEAEAARAKLVKAGAVDVIMHKLSFQDKLLEAAGTERSWVHRAVGSYLRLDVPSFLPDVRHALSQWNVESEYILWTDPDVIFRGNIDSCTLGKPTLLSLGGDVGHELVNSGGVIYFNISAYSEIFSNFIEHAALQGFGTETVAMDQGMLLTYLQGFSTLLPDLYNYKPYWGAPKSVAWEASGQPVIVHMQGPKVNRAVCALRDFLAQKPSPEQLQAKEWPGRSETLSNCHIAHKDHAYFSALLEHAYGADKGQMYFEVAEEFGRLASTIDGLSSQQGTDVR